MELVSRHVVVATHEVLPVSVCTASLGRAVGEVLEASEACVAPRLALSHGEGAALAEVVIHGIRCFTPVAEEPPHGVLVTVFKLESIPRRLREDSKVAATIVGPIDLMGDERRVRALPRVGADVPPPLNIVVVNVVCGNHDSDDSVFRPIEIVDPYVPGIPVDLSYTIGSLVSADDVAAEVVLAASMGGCFRGAKNPEWNRDDGPDDNAQRESEPPPPDLL